MATPTDPSFGADFDGDQFRSAIISAMEMGMANGDAVATFYWDNEYEYEFGSEGGLVPYDLTDDPASRLQRAKTVVVPCAVNFVSRATASENNSFGQIQSPRVEVTVLDTWFPSVETADGIMFDDSKYTIDYVSPVMGLFDVNVYMFYASTLDES